MIILTKNNAKQRCRTCLRQLLNDEEKSCDMESAAASLQKKFVDINSNKELKEMLEKILPIQWDVNFYKDQLYPQHICIECLKHLQDFANFRNKAVDSANKLYKVFSGCCNVQKIELNDDGLECKFDAEEYSITKVDMFNLFLKDSLMETEAIILNYSDLNNGVNSIDPDPFLITQKQNKIKKQRTRKVKDSSVCILNSKKIIRKSKRPSSSKENKLRTYCEKKLVHSRNEIGLEKNEDYHKSFYLHDVAFHDPEDDSSDNEVLSKKIKHSDNEIRKETVMNSNERESNSYSNHEYRPVLLQSKEDLQKIVLKKDSLEIIKTEIDSSSEANADTESFANLKKVEKKKRHYIINSGRKKGLANRFKCDQCQHKFGHKLTLEAHVRKVHEGEKKAFKCQLCNKAYSFVGGLSTHIRDVHERKQDSYDCNVPGCDKKYSNLITLQRHVRFKHLNMETAHQYVCEQCGATFKQSSNLRYHMKTRHPTEEDLKRKELLPKDRLECEECKKSFHSQYTLKYHKLRVHADEKKFECKICGRRVAKQFMLDSHMLVHSDQKMACKFCGREFVRKYQVEAHIRAVHQKLKPFQCPHCSESFASRKTLRHHIYIHTGEKPYICDICGQAYRQPTCLKNHRKIHNKLSTHSATTALAVNRSFIGNFVQNNDDVLADADKTLVLSN